MQNSTLIDLRAELLKQAFNDTEPEDYPEQTYRRLQSTDPDLSVYAWSDRGGESGTWEVYADLGDVEDAAAARKAAQSLALVANQVRILNAHGRVFEVDADNSRTNPVAGGQVYLYRQEGKVRAHAAETMPHLDHLTPGAGWGSGDTRYDCNLIGRFDVLDAELSGTSLRLLVADVHQPDNTPIVTDEGEDG
ncbi:hypothetical protein [Leifsonia shinshuensis]|uniref:Uncharacterized protein n=1 Tax=Leifsonia shinshuensis TaxID=150026 RepID=A0A853CT13_9MICO|nr:hypothetical protein [Leifsonia shinshuensis]NYJ23479.1 hypothetical protein [Leifsonia shinshuensis]